MMILGAGSVMMGWGMEIYLDCVQQEKVNSIAFLVGLRDELQHQLDAKPALDLDTLKTPQSEFASEETFMGGWNDALTNVKGLLAEGRELSWMRNVHHIRGPVHRSKGHCVRADIVRGSVLHLWGGDHHLHGWPLPQQAGAARHIRRGHGGVARLIVLRILWFRTRTIARDLGRDGGGERLMNHSNTWMICRDFQQ